MDGVKAAEITKKKLDIPMIFVIASEKNYNIDRAKALEPFGYFMKPPIATVFIFAVGMAQCSMQKLHI